MQPCFIARESRALRVTLGLFALLALLALLLTAWLRWFVPSSRHALRVRDVSWLPHQER